MTNLLNAVRSSKWLVLFLGMLLALSVPRVSNAQDASTVKVTVQVTDTGFNSNPDGFTINVEQGKLVDLTFVWSHSAQYQSDEHIFVLDGYKLEWDKINTSKREANLKFIASKTGSFDFKCDFECDLHRLLQRGVLKVSAGSGGAAGAAATKTTMTVTPSTFASVGETVNLMVVLKDQSGAPVVKSDVHFMLDAEFVGTSGKMNIGSAKTDANGVAFLNFKPTVDMPKQKITARYEGGGIYGESEQSVEILQALPPSPAYIADPIGLDAIRQGAPVALVLVLLTVWSTFGFVLFQVFRIAKVSKGGDVAARRS